MAHNRTCCCGCAPEITVTVAGVDATVVTGPISVSSYNFTLNSLSIDGVYTVPLLSTARGTDGLGKFRSCQYAPSPNGTSPLQPMYGTANVDISAGRFNTAYSGDVQMFIYAQTIKRQGVPIPGVYDIRIGTNWYSFPPACGVVWQVYPFWAIGSPLGDVGDAIPNNASLSSIYPPDPSGFEWFVADGGTVTVALP